MSSPAPDPRRQRLVLPPGTVDVPRPGGLLQVGHDTAAVTLPDAHAVRSLLAALTADGVVSPRREDPAEVWVAWQRLHEAGLLVPARAVHRAREAVRGTALDGRAADAAVLRLAGEAAAALRERTATRVAVHGPEVLAAPARAALSGAGLAVLTPPGRSTGRAPGQASGRDADPAGGDVHLVLSDVRPAADVVDALVRADRPHLPVVRDVSGVRLGPFVMPGVTACLGCLEATRADRDPDQGLVRLLRARAMRGHQMPGDPALLASAVALAAREVALWAAGEEPSTWSSTWWLGHDGTDRRDPLPRHPRCGCAWDALLLPAG